MGCDGLGSAARGIQAYDGDGSACLGLWLRTARAEHRVQTQTVSGEGTHRSAHTRAHTPTTERRLSQPRSRSHAYQYARTSAHILPRTEHTRAHCQPHGLTQLCNRSQAPTFTQPRTRTTTAHIVSHATEHATTHAATCTATHMTTRTHTATHDIRKPTPRANTRAGALYASRVIVCARTCKRERAHEHAHARLQQFLPSAWS